LYGSGFVVVEIHAVINPGHSYEIGRFRLHISYNTVNQSKPLTPIGRLSTITVSTQLQQQIQFRSCTMQKMFWPLDL